ncbi:MAG: NAD(+) diphosphatase [Chloroflexota bacterium]
MLDRPFVPATVPIDTERHDGWCVLVRGNEPLVVSGSELRIGRLQEVESLVGRSCRIRYLGELYGEPCYTAEVDSDFCAPPGSEFVGLRELWSHVPEPDWEMAGRAVQIVDWERSHRYCGACGVPTVDGERERAMVCPDCGLKAYPRLSPAVIMLVHKGDQVLLGRSNRFKSGFYSVLAGFVEAGENLEQAVEREVYEETRIRIKDITYFGSQPWPFPNSLMIGFTAEYESGTIRLLDDEILEAGWFTLDNLPQLPGKISIARKLTDWWITSRGGVLPVD